MLHQAPPRSGYVAPQPQVKPLTRPAAHPRRASEQDVVLPSVEREIVDFKSPPRLANGQSSYQDHRSSLHLPLAKRSSFSSFPDDRGHLAEPGTKRQRPVYSENLATSGMRPVRTFAQAGPSDYMGPEERGRFRAQPPLEVVDLTSPRQQATNGDRSRYALLHERSMIDPRAYPRVPIVSRQQPTRQVGGSHYNLIADEPPRAYAPDNGMYARHASPARDYIPVSGDPPRQHVELEGARVLRSGVQYGGHNVR